jgi:hypothetical protein
MQRVFKQFGPLQIALLSWQLPAELRITTKKQPVSRPRFEPGISTIKFKTLRLHQPYSFYTPTLHISLSSQVSLTKIRTSHHYKTNFCFIHTSLALSVSLTGSVVGDKAETTCDGTLFSPSLINIALAMISTPWRHIRRERNRRVTPIVKNRGTR